MNYKTKSDEKVNLRLNKSTYQKLVDAKLNA